MASVEDITKKNKEKIKARTVIQQCISAKLQVAPSTADIPAQYTGINRGIVVFVSFMKECDRGVVEKLANLICDVKLIDTDYGQASILNTHGDVLVIPQACLGGKLRGKSVQYHGIIDKTTGEELYQYFVKLCQSMISSNPVSSDEVSQPVVRYGTYGIRQVLSMETNGPYTHVFDL